MINRKSNNNAGFTLIEILMASIIFVITVGGVFVTLNYVRTPLTAQQTALTAAIFGKQVLEALRSGVTNGGAYNACSAVNGDGSCADFSLFLGQHEVPQANWPAGLIVPPNFAANNPNGLTYMVTCADNSAAPCSNIAHTVTLNVNY